MLEETEVDCPYCGEEFTATVDCSAGNQRYVEDCPVCCQPIEFDARVGEDARLIHLGARRDDD